MKKIILINVILSINFFTYCQDTNSFVINNRTWSVIYCQFETAALPPSTTCGTEDYKIIEDTTIESKTYYEVYQKYGCYESNYHSAGFYLREDSSKKVYLSYGCLEDKLIYDFNLQIGDSIDADFEIGQIPLYAKVDTVDSILVNDIYRKRIIFEEWFDETWIEGLGSLANPFNPFSRNKDIDMSHELLCVKDSLDIIYLNPNYDSCCYFWSDLKENMEHDQINDYNIRILPNPSFNTLKIEILNCYTRFNEINIIDVSGKIVLSKEIYDFSFEINVNDLPSGIYFLNLIGKSEIITKKIILNK